MFGNAFHSWRGNLYLRYLVAVLLRDSVRVLLGQRKRLGTPRQRTYGPLGLFLHALLSHLAFLRKVQRGRRKNINLIIPRL